MYQTVIVDDYAPPSLTVGQQYRFIYPDYGTPPSLPDYIAHSGVIITIIRSLNHPDEYENMGDPMYKVESADGWQADAWESELHPLDYPWPNSVDQNGNPVAKTA